jgi:zinc protease
MSALRPLLLLLTPLFFSVAVADGVTLPDAERVMLDNGTVLILIENHDVPLIGLQAVIRGGAVADPADKHGLANLLAGLLEKGAGDRSSSEFAEAVASVGGELSSSADSESVTISAEFMATDAALMIELVADLVLRPQLSQLEFEKLRDRSINLIKSAKGSDPTALMAAYANAFLFGDHPYGNPLGGSESSLANITHGDARAYYTEMFGGDRLIISVSGDFDIDTMKEALIASFGGWAATPGALPEIAVSLPATERRVLLIDKPGATQTYFYFGNVGVAMSYPKRAELDLADIVFGGRLTSMLNTELRIKSGLTYGAHSALSRNEKPGAVFVFSFTETSTTKEAIDLALTVLDRLHDNGLDEAMIESARNYIMGQYPTLLETASQVAGIFALLESAGLDASYINDYGDGLSAATPESVNSAIDEVYPTSDSLVFIILGDAELIRGKIAQYGAVTEIAISEPSFHPN